MIYAYAWGVVTVEEMLAHNARMIELLEAGTPPVHALLHSDITKLPSLRLDVARSMSNAHGHPALERALLISRQNPINEFISRTLARFFGVKYKNFPTLDEAIAFLKAQDDSIDWSQVDNVTG